MYNLHWFSLMWTPYVTIVHLSKLRCQHWCVTITEAPDFIQIFATSPNVPFLLHDATLHLIIRSVCSLEPEPDSLSFLIFMTLTVLKNIAQVFCRLSLILDLSAVFLIVRKGSWAWGKNSTEVRCPSYCVTGWGTRWQRGLSLVKLTVVTWLR